MGEAFSSLPSWPCLPYPWLPPLPSPRLKPKLNPSTTMVERRMDLTIPTTEDTLPPMDNTTEETDTTTRDTMDSMDTRDTTNIMDSTTDSTTDSTMDSTTDLTTDSTDSQPKAGNYRFMSVYRVSKSS